MWIRCHGYENLLFKSLCWCGDEKCFQGPGIWEGTSSREGPGYFENVSLHIDLHYQLNRWGWQWWVHVGYKLFFRWGLFRSSACSCPSWVGPQNSPKHMQVYAQVCVSVRVHAAPGVASRFTVSANHETFLWWTEVDQPDKEKANLCSHLETDSNLSFYLSNTHTRSRTHRRTQNRLNWLLTRCPSRAFIGVVQGWLKRNL